MGTQTPNLPLRPTLDLIIGHKDLGAGAYELAQMPARNLYAALGGFKPQNDWAIPTAYTVGDCLSKEGIGYVCIVSHTAASTNEPGVGVDWEDYWFGVNLMGEQGPVGPGYAASSTTSLSIATGTKVFTVAAGLAYSAGVRARASSASDLTKYMEGVVASYSGTTLTITVDAVGGSGTKADWNINVIGDIGPTGPGGGPAGPGYAASSATSLSIGTGSKAFTVATGLAYSAGARVRAASASDTSKYMEGVVASYSGSTLTVTVDRTGGSGTVSDWNINLAGESALGYGGTSTTSQAIATGSKTFATQTGLAYSFGARVRIASAGNLANYMEGQVTAYSGGSLTVSVDRISGAGTHTDWNIGIAGDAGGVQSIFPVKAYGAVGDYLAVADAAMTSGSSTLTSAAGLFTAAHVGKYIAVQGAASAGAHLFTTIATYVSATQVTLTAPNASGGSISGKFAEWGTDDTSAFQAAIDAAKTAGGGVVYAPTGSYLISRLNLAGITISVELVGDGINSTRLFPKQVSAYTTSAGHVIDRTGSAFVKLRRFQLGAYYSLPLPKTGIFLAQIASGVSNRIQDDEVYVSGQYAVATYYNYGVPSSIFRGCDYYNYKKGAGSHRVRYCTATNEASLTSDFATVTSGFCSTSDVLFDKCETHKFADAGANNEVDRYDTTTNIKVHSGVISGGATQYVTFVGACVDMTFDQVTMETESQPVTPTNAFNIASGATLSGLKTPGTSWIIAGAPIAGSGALVGAGELGEPPAGQAQLVYVSSTQIRLDRCNGSKLFIQGRNWIVPASGPTLANTGLTAATLYYIYAYMSGTTMTLEASATAPAVDSIFGHKIKTSDATRTLVGMVYMGAGTPGTFVDSTASRTVASYYQRRRRSCVSNAIDTSTTTSSSATAINSSTLAKFLVWGDDEPILTGTAIIANNNAAGCAFTIGVDGTANANARSQLNNGNANQQTPFATTYLAVLSEGYHYVTGYMNSVTATHTTTAFSLNVQATMNI